MHIGIMIITPVNGYHAPAALKSMIDRMAWADGGNPDPLRLTAKQSEKQKHLS
jgi:NAD(P)H-dependent FMN reductase